MASRHPDSGELASWYATALWAHLDSDGEEMLAMATDLGRVAHESSLETLDLARMHEFVFDAISQSLEASRAPTSRAARADSFFAAAVLPIEASHDPTAEVLRSCESECAALREENRRGVERVRELGVERREQAHQFLALLDDERRRISRDLHDALGQTLTGAHIALARLAEDASASSDQLRRNVTQTRRLVQRSMKEIHRFATRLHPAMLDDVGLIPSLRSLTRGLERETSLEVRLSSDDDIPDLGDEQRTAVFRVVQEALTNVRRHARAGRVLVSVQRGPDALRVRVEDDGRSFESSPPRRRGRSRLGILCMQERMAMVGGSLTIETSPGIGTVVRAELPLDAPRCA